MKKLEKNRKPIEIALLGNPNSGKTTIFNALTGLRHTTANYPGVTVEKRAGKLKGSGGSISILDLPGSYSLLPRSLDEEVVHDVLLGIQKGTPPPDLTVVVLDANNFERNLYLACQVIETGLPVILALNMWDLAEENGFSIDLDKLEAIFGVPCVKVIGNKKEGTKSLKNLINKELIRIQSGTFNPGYSLPIPNAIENELLEISNMIKSSLKNREKSARGEAFRLLTDIGFNGPFFKGDEFDKKLKSQILVSRSRLEEKNIDWSSVETELRYSYIESVTGQVAKLDLNKKVSSSERLDKVLTHKFWGLPIFAGLMALVFQSIFNWANAPMDWISSAVSRLGVFVSGALPEGQLNSLIVDGIISGVGNVLVFLPQIFLLFFFIAFFEDIGYMARAAFVLDRLMKKVGLNGKAFLPLLSSFACAVPGIMAARTIEDKNDRLATILIAPLMSCSARLPVYTLMIGAFIPAVPIFIIFDLKGITLFAMYFTGILAALGMALLFRKTFLKGNKTPFIFELPPYRIPNLKTVGLAMWERGKEFIYRAGSIIFCISIVLWLLASYPKDASLEKQFNIKYQKIEQVFRGENLESKVKELQEWKSTEDLNHSFAGRLGHLIEPAVEPLGFDWKMGIGLIASFAAREVMVSTLAIVHNVGGEADETSVSLIEALQNEISPITGKPVYTPLVAVSLMVFFALACQCMATVAIVKKETNSWRWPIFMVVYMSALAWIGSFAVYQGGKLLGFG